MAIIDFYEKPGCIGNAKQKQVLLQAGHELNIHNLLTETWSSPRLRPFFGDLPVNDWFNPTAPPITAGKIDPNQLSEDAALALMVAQPILIRRPLLQVGDRCEAGFDMVKIHTWLGLSPKTNLSEDIQTCPSRKLSIASVELVRT